MTSLRVACRLKHDPTRRYIISRIELDYSKQDPVDLIEAANLGGSTHGLTRNYQLLAQRGESITAEEGKKMGFDAMVEICRLREESMYAKGSANGYEKGHRDSKCTRKHK